MKNQIEIDFKIDPEVENVRMLSNPEGYKGIAAFHKYWGKKPIECLNFIIEKFTNQNDIILDPFVGSGLIALETLKRNRKFIGMDINPISIELTTLMAELPSYERIKDAVSEIEKKVKDQINSCYQTQNNSIATHYLYSGNEIQSVWIKGHKNQRIELSPDKNDIELLEKFREYKTKNIGNPQFFQNSRINTDKTMTIYDLFTTRALFCIDTLIDQINRFEPDIRRALLLVLTSSSGQMSKMVFAIANRGKKSGLSSDKIEVGSWAIGYWRSTIHFEINVWNCFLNKANKLLKSLKYIDKNPYVNISKSLEDIFDSGSNLLLILGDTRTEIKRFRDDSIDLVITDPPHGDRIPYLELSSMWNAILNAEPQYSNEIVVSNAKERGKNLTTYNEIMEEVTTQLFRVLKPDGILALIFNSTDIKYWEFLINTSKHNGISFIGCFPMNYSASSIVQDNRRGALKQDFVLIYIKCPTANRESVINDLSSIPGWSNSYPVIRS